MNVHASADSLLYTVTDDGHVTVQVVIGDAQGGGWVVAWDSAQVIHKGSAAELVTVGQGKEIRARTLQIVATAVDIRQESNRLSSVITISGGADGTKTMVHQYSEGGAGDTAIFTTIVRFA
jgi:hypothetical protein